MHGTQEEMTNRYDQVEGSEKKTEKRHAAKKDRQHNLDFAEGFAEMSVVESLVSNFVYGGVMGWCHARCLFFSVSCLILQLSGCVRPAVLYAIHRWQGRGAGQFPEKDSSTEWSKCIDRIQGSASSFCHRGWLL